MNASLEISQLYKETFTLEKVRADLFEYMDRYAESFTQNHLEYVVDAYIEFEEDKYETITITKGDKITILHYQSFLDFGVEFQFNVIVAIGNFSNPKKSLALFEIEKCLAKLRYNPDLSCYDIEFYINRMNKTKN